MDYIKNIIAYIEENIEQIHLPKHKLYEKFNVSESKLKKDFKNTQGITILSFLQEKKVQWINTNFDKIEAPILQKVNYNYCVKTYTNHVKKYITCSEGDKELEPYFFHNIKVLEEVLIRLILHAKWAKIEWQTKFKVFIKINVKNTSLKFFPFGPPLEFEHIHFIFFDLDTFKFNYSLCIDTENEGGIGLTTIVTHLTLLYSLSERLKDELKFSIIDSIVNWESHVETILKSTGFYQYVVKKKSNIPLRINEESDFIKHTDCYVTELKNKFIKFFRDELDSRYGIELDSFQQYLKNVEENNYLGMFDFLTIHLPCSLDKLQFLLDLTISPYVEGDSFYRNQKEFIYDIDLLESILNKEKPELIEIFINLRKKVIELEEYEDNMSSILKESINFHNVSNT